MKVAWEPLSKIGGRAKEGCQRDLPQRLFQLEWFPLGFFHKLEFHVGTGFKRGSVAFKKKNGIGYSTKNNCSV